MDHLQALLWPEERGLKRGPKPSMTREQIVEAAVATADTEGLAGLSMQRLAEQLGVSKMALYRYVPGRAELTALMLEVAIGPAPDLTSVRGGWRPKLRAWGLQGWETFRHHRWALEVAVGVRVMGPNEVGWLEAALAPLSRTRLTLPECLDTVALVTGHVRSILQQETPVPAPAQVESGLVTAMDDILAKHGAAYPTVVRALARGEDTDRGRDDALAFGLDRILDGVAVLNDRRGRS